MHNITEYWTSDVYRIRFKKTYCVAEREHSSLYWGISERAAASLPVYDSDMKSHIQPLITYAENAALSSFMNMEREGIERDHTSLFVEMQINFMIGRMPVDNLSFIYHTLVDTETNKSNTFIAVIEQPEAEMYRSERATKIIH